MEGFLLVVISVFIIFISVTIRVIAGSFDRTRITNDIASRGGKVTGIEWRPFGPGWFGSQYSRIYEVFYFDMDGNHHAAFCKTSALGGIYWSEDRIDGNSSGKIPSNLKSQKEVELEEENRKLRNEIRRLRDING